MHYWASPLEARLCAGQEVALVGAGNSAGQAAVYLAGQAAKVWMMVRGHGLKASMSRYLVDRIAGIPNIEVVTETGSAARGTRRQARRDAWRDRERHRDGAAGAPPVPVHRRRAQHRLAGGYRHRARRQGIHRDRRERPGTRSRPALPACSRSATCARARSSGSPPRSAKAPRWWPRSTPISPGTARSYIATLTTEESPMPGPCTHKKTIRT